MTEHWPVTRIRAEISKARQHKYRNEPCWSDGQCIISPTQKQVLERANQTFEGWVWFQSKKEARRWCELLRREAKGEIRELTRQKKYKLAVKGVSITTYTCDFRYIEDDVPVVEDAKGFKTEKYKIQRALMKAVYGIEIRET